MKVFSYENYKVFVQKHLSHLPGAGYGQLTKIAEHLGVHTSMVSQVFNGSKHLTFDQACKLCDYFGLTELESDYFVALVQFERAGTPESRKKCKRDLEALRSKATTVSNRLSQSTKLSDADNAIFYSHWFYTAIKLITSLPQINSLDDIAEKLQLKRSSVQKAVEFLTATGLCISENGKLKPGPANTHISGDSPLVSRHHQNWRMKGFEKMSASTPQDLFFTMPATLSQKDTAGLRRMIVDFIESVGTVVDSSKPDSFWCLNIDWYEVLK